MPIDYEVINKATLGIYPVKGLRSNEAFMEVTIDNAEGTEEVLTFKTNEGEGFLFNETFAIRRVDNHAQPDGTGTVEIEEGQVVYKP